MSVPCSGMSVGVDEDVSEGGSTPPNGGDQSPATLAANNAAQLATSGIFPFLANNASKEDLLARFKNKNGGTLVFGFWKSGFLLVLFTCVRLVCILGN